jgi:hypothetical protein
MEAIKNKEPKIFKMTENWDAQSKKLQEKYPKLTDADLKFETGKEEELLKRVETRLDKKRDEVIAILVDGQSKNLN